jgi:hypothetical protein
MMTPLDPVDQLRADRLGAYGDALVDGIAPPPTDEIEATLARAWRAFGGGPATTGRMPDAVRSRLLEALMPPITTAVAHPRLVAAPRRAEPSRTAPPPERTTLPIAGGWQAAASFALVLAVLAALVAVAWRAGGGPGDSTPTSFAAQGLYDEDDISTFPMMPETCVPNGEIDDDGEPEDRSIDDWAAPEYGPAQAVDHETGLAIQETYMNYFRCEWDHFHPDIPGGGTPAALPTGPSPEMMTYFSDRARFDRMYGSLSPEQRAELDDYRCLPRVDRIMETFPLPVNQPRDYAIMSLLPVTGEIDELAQVFTPSDVYLLPDGRYGAIIGTVTTAALDDPDAVTRDDHLLFIAFVEADGRYYIDEIFTVFALDMDFPDGRNGTILMECE